MVFSSDSLRSTLQAALKNKMVTKFTEAEMGYSIRMFERGRRCNYLSYDVKKERDKSILNVL